MNGHGPVSGPSRRILVLAPRARGVPSSSHWRSSGPRSMACASCRNSSSHFDRPELLGPAAAGKRVHLATRDSAGDSTSSCGTTRSRPLEHLCRAGRRALLSPLATFSFRTTSSLRRRRYQGLEERERVRARRSRHSRLTSRALTSRLHRRTRSAGSDGRCNNRIRGTEPEIVRDIAFSSRTSSARTPRCATSTTTGWSRRAR